LNFQYNIPDSNK